MYIKSIVIDGFKSYGTRTEVKGFDPEFNAITGLNGTGKSNILDSICFVLGISNLTHVRANSLQDLIYKSGQAGITKASVSITFDNSEPNQSPINYEQCKEIIVTRQIVVAGKNRYLINGTVVTNKHVNDFFNSIQLNVNNPHFLIMQGRITKVLNMKPLEILSMIEEAAGTRMYENKKIGAQKTIVKKDSRLKEIDEIVAESIGPKIQRMKEERDQLIEFQKIQRELEHLSKIVAAYDFTSSIETKAVKETEIENSKIELKETQSSIASSKSEIESLESQINEIQLKRDSESGGELKEFEDHLKELEKIEVTSSVKLKSAKESLNAEKKRHKQLEKSVKDDEKAFTAKQNELGQAQSVFDELRKAEQMDADALSAAQLKLQAVSSGLLASDDGENASLQDQLMSAKQQLTEFETEVKQCNIEIKHFKTELNQKKPLLKNTEKTFAQDQRELDVKEKELESLKSGLSKLNYEEGRLERLQEQARDLNSQIRHSSDTVNGFESRYPQLSFSYKDPEPNFNRDLVRGLLCKLFKVKDEKFARAIETAAGGRLYNVVVDNESVSSKLIKKGQLARRTTFVPLNKIQGSKMNQRVIQSAERIVGQGNVFLAQSLVEYEPQYEQVMSWVFGQTLICTTTDHAKKVSFHPDVKKKSITIDGVVFDPAGVISGGATDRSQPILLALMKVVQAEKDLKAKRQELNGLNQEINKISPIAQNYDSYKQKFDLRTRELEMIRARLQQTSHYQLQQELETLETTIRNKEARILECKKEIKEKSVKVTELENKMKNLKQIKEKELKDAEAELKRIKKKAEDSRNKWKQREQEFETLNLEIQELEKSVQHGKEQLAELDQVILKSESEVEKLAESVTKAHEDVVNMKAEVKSKKDAISKKNSEIERMNSQKDKLHKQISEKELQVVSINHTLKKLERDLELVEKMISDLKNDNRWIEESQQYFGQPNGMFDFKTNNPKEAFAKMEKLKQLRDKMGKQAKSSSVLDVLSSQEEQYQQVLNKKDIIQEDRSKLLSVIEELDGKKLEVIKIAWEKVNTDFNSILSSLLPSAQACLRPIDPDDLMKGLQVKVGFGGLWKDSLDELSGGQRSLIALSLILAMLRFKPAPLYILDEVDAALDPSHTQNIGQMLKAHFKQSQFIVVSLKDGMFNNANVLFRTNFVDGMSAVMRTTRGH